MIDDRVFKHNQSVFNESNFGEHTRCIDSIDASIDTDGKYSQRLSITEAEDFLDEIATNQTDNNGIKVIAKSAEVKDNPELKDVGP